MRRTHEPIPKDFEVQPLRPGQKAEDPVTCGHCGLTWDDGIGTTWTPAPSGRCPFEYFHIHEEDLIINTLFRDFAAERGWTPDTQLTILLNFLDSADMPGSVADDLEQFLNDLADEEDGTDENEPGESDPPREGEAPALPTSR
jgi:hypothetical protein